MIEIFYKSKGQVLPSNEMALLNDLGWDDVLWIDLFEPTGEEKRSVEEFLETTLQSRAQAEEIESSSRYSETETTIFANTTLHYFCFPLLKLERTDLSLITHSMYFFQQYHLALNCYLAEILELPLMFRHRIFRLWTN